ncbi:MAG: hypothetical protein KGP35_01845 [Bacteroidetes bacterium]|nr:hypothetical protein [Bacteroidota bacterium]
MRFSIKTLLPHLGAIAIFLLISIIYCKPALEGKVLNAHDNQGWKGMAQQSFEYKEKYGRFPLWTNSMFSGMPTFQIAMDGIYHFNIQWLGTVLTLGLPKPINFFFLACLAFYLLALSLQWNRWIGILTALGYAFATYNPIIIGAGHDTKMLAIGYAPLVVAGVLLIINQRKALGIAGFSTGLALQISTGHLQIVYYTGLIIGIITIGFLLRQIQKKSFKQVLITLITLAIISVIAFGYNAGSTLPTMDYSKASMRGGESELKDIKDKNTTGGGLDKDYAFKYSVGLGETFTMLVPGLYGGSNGGDEYTNSAFAEKLTEVGYPEDQALQYANGISYWGDQQPTSGPVYFGAVMIFLLFISMLQKKDYLKWSLLAAGIIGIILAWGKNLSAVNYFLFDYLPYYKKFRAPSMALFMPQLTFTVIAGMGLQQLFSPSQNIELKKFLKKALVSIVGLSVITGYIYLSNEYSGSGDKDLKEGMKSAMLQQSSPTGAANPALEQEAEKFGKEFVTAIQTDRKSLAGADLIRSIILMALAFVIIWWALKQKQYTGGIIALGVLCLFDLLSIDKRYLNNDKFVEQTDFQNSFAMSAADTQIKQDTGYFRVFNTATDPFNESITAYHHNSIGGYHPAKLQLYQDLIEYQISKNNRQVLNMLNTKYVIIRNPQTGETMAQQNPEAFGPCWLAKGIKYVNNGKEEMNALDNTPLKDTAVVQVKFKKNIPSNPIADSTASLNFIFNKNDSIRYRSAANSPQFAVFSEVYYDRGWNAFIDDQPAPIIKTNYALRGLFIPAGKHEILFKFEPKSYFTGGLISLICSILIYLILAAAVYMEWRQSRDLTS